MSLSQTEILKSRLRDVFTSAMHFYQLLQLHTDDPDYIPLAHEFEAGLTLLDSSIGEEEVLVAGRASLIRFRDDAKDGFPLQGGPSKPHEPLLKQRGLNALRSCVEYRTRNSPDAGYVSKWFLAAKSYSSTTVPAFPQQRGGGALQRRAILPISDAMLGMVAELERSFI